MDTALVIAAGSFVGRHLCDRLRTLGIPFAGTSRTPQTGLHACDLTRPGEVAAVVRAFSPRWIFQCAGATARCSPTEQYQLHVGGTQELLEAVHVYAPGAVVVLFGSAAEYGAVPPEQLPIREEVDPQPRSSYGQSKLAQFQLAERLSRAWGLRVHVVRPFNLLGPGLGEQYFAQALCARLRQRVVAGAFGAVTIHNGQATRDWVDVRDVAEAVCRLALHAPVEPGRLGLCNIATGQETAVLTLAAELCRLAGDFHPIDEGKVDSRTEIDRSCGDGSRLRAWTGWQPRYSWQESLRALWTGGQT